MHDYYSVWDEVYSKTLANKHAFAGTIVSRPRSLSYKSAHPNLRDSMKGGFAYILQGTESNQQLTVLAEILAKIESTDGICVSIFEHPRYPTQSAEILRRWQVSKGFNAAAGISKFQYVCAVNSTVLFECYCLLENSSDSSRLVVNDLFGDPKLTEWPKTMRYLLLSELSNTDKLS